MPELVFAFVVVVALPVRAWRRHLRSAPPAPPARYIAETVLLTTALVLLLRRNGVAPEALGLGPETPLRFLGDLLFCLAIVVGPDVWSVQRTIRHIRRGGGGVAAPDGVFADALAGGRSAGSFVAVSIVGAVWEELCFRATLFVLVPRTMPALLAALLAGALVFAAQHLRNGWRGALFPFCYAIVFSVLYLATGDLVAVIVAHAAGNILAAIQWAPRIERARLEASGKVPSFIG